MHSHAVRVAVPQPRRGYPPCVLHIHRAARADALADALAALLRAAPADPFAADVVSVPTRGMERWLTQSLSATLGASPAGTDGVCANVLFPPPHRLLADCVAAASGIDPEHDPWLPERAVWPLLEVVDRHLGDPWLAGLAVYLGGDSGDEIRRSRRLTVVRHLGALFDRYALHRPVMLERWAGGDDLDAAGEPLPAGAAWQAELWRRLRARIPVADPAQRRAAACERLARDPAIVDLPPRLSLFGLTRLAAGHLRILRALAAEREVHLFLLHPSPALWAAVAARTQTAGAVQRRAADHTADAASNRLLGSWGRDVREMQLVLGPCENTAGYEHGPAHAGDDHDSGSGGAAPTLLQRIQDDIRADRPAPGRPLDTGPDSRAPLEAADISLQIHSCHGRVRQVEVVRDAILHALADDETLEPRDVIVMCPDIETFAPLIQATFGAGETASGDDDASPDRPAPIEGRAQADRPAPIDLRVRLADRSLRQTNPLLGVVSLLLELVPGRLTASDVLDLADREPVRRRFAFDDDDLARVRDWTLQAGIRWGLDAAHRAPFKLDVLDAGTWRQGLDRLLLGVTMTEEGQRLFERTLPLDDVDSRSIDLAGRFAELIDRLGDAVDALSVGQPLSAWSEAIADSADALAATSAGERWQRAELQRILDEMVTESAGADGPDLAPAEVRAFLADRLQGRPTRANFRTGHLTVCTLMPMRSVPHRVVCLLGLDDGAFPRKAPRDGDDLMLDDPHVGERDPRSEDRQLLLDALLASTERLIVTYSGNDERTNMPRPPAVPVGELLDVVDATARPAGHGAGSAADRVVIRHPLQPFDPRNFTAGALTGDRAWSFDRVTLEGARALTGPRPVPRRFLAAPLPGQAQRVIELQDLVRFLEHPVRAFLRQRLGVSLRASADEIDDALTVELDGLGRWGVGRRLLEARLRGVDGRTAGLAEIARGTLPPGVLGRPVIRAVYPIVDAIVTEAFTLAGDSGGAEPVDVRVALDDGRMLMGTVTGVRGDVLLATTFSRVSARHRLASWARLLALSAGRPQRPFSAVTVGRGGGDDIRVALVAPLAGEPSARGERALEHLAVLVDLYDRGMREPLPIFCMTSAAYAEAAARGQDAPDAARREWETEWRFDREDRELEHQLVLGGVLTAAELMARAPRADERGPGWAESEESRLGRYARRLWDGLLAHEEISAR